MTKGKKKNRTREFKGYFIVTNSGVVMVIIHSGDEMVSLCYLVLCWVHPVVVVRSVAVLCMVGCYPKL